MQNTALQFSEVIHQCRDLFSKKLQDYGAAWRVLRPSSITDQIYIKVNRIRTLQMTDVKMVDEHEEDEFIAIVNYSIIGLIQLEKGFSENLDEDKTEILKLYDDYAQKAKDLMLRKNHDYGEAWRFRVYPAHFPTLCISRKVVPLTGLEPVTPALRMRCSTN